MNQDTRRTVSRSSARGRVNADGAIRSTRPGTATAWRTKGNVPLRAEALRQLRWQQQAWERALSLHVAGTPCLVPPADRAGLNDSLDLLREAGEEVPARLYRRGSLVRNADAARGTHAGVSLASLVADIDRVLAWFDIDRHGLARHV